MFLPPAFIELKHLNSLLKTKSYLPSNRPRRYIMRAAEGGKKIVQGNFVRKVNNCQLGAPLALVAMEQVVVANGKVKQMTRRNPRRVLVVILCPRSWNAYQCRTVL